jgi:hypothetical protein
MKSSRIQWLCKTRKINRFIIAAWFRDVTCSVILLTDLPVVKHERFETFVTGILHLIQINHQHDAIIFQFIILMFVYRSTGFGRFSTHHQEHNDCSGSFLFYLRIVVTVVLCSWSGRLQHTQKCSNSSTIAADSSNGVTNTRCCR